MERALKILLLSFDFERLHRREVALRSNGWEVKSVYSPGQARFEIEMGTCGIFVTCRQVPDIVNQDLMNLFRRFCGKHGLIILVAPDEVSSRSAYEPQADIRVPESLDPEGIVQALREHSQSLKAGA